ncbi:hypothetical protein N8853_00775, partial [bacterium]|nr:hypothetical protein [bacterium]
ISRNTNKNKIAYSGIRVTAKNCSVILILIAFAYVANNFLNFVSNENLILIATSVLLTIFFVTLESVFVGNRIFVGLMLINLLYYGFSLSLPSIFLFFQYYNYQEVFFGSILIKIIVVLLSTTYLIKYNYIKFHKIKNYTNFKSSKWFSISLFLSQIYDFSDKYLVKTLLGPAALAIYVVPQQLSGKLSIFSKGFSSVLLPSISLSEKKQTQNKSFLLTLKLFIFVLPIILFSFFFISDYFLILWLGINYPAEILQLLKIFIIVNWFACLSHLFVTYYEGSGNVKKNTNIEILFLPIFIPFLILASISKSLILIAMVMLGKEIVLLFLRTFKLIKKIKIIPIMYLVSALVVFILFYLEILV